MLKSSHFRTSWLSADGFASFFIEKTEAIEIELPQATTVISTLLPASGLLVSAFPAGERSLLLSELISWAYLILSSLLKGLNSNNSRSYKSNFGPSTRFFSSTYKYAVQSPNLKIQLKTNSLSTLCLPILQLQPLPFFYSPQEPKFWKEMECLPPLPSLSPEPTPIRPLPPCAAEVAPVTSNCLNQMGDSQSSSP